MKELSIIVPVICLILVLRCIAAMVKRSDPAWKKAVYLPNWLFFFALVLNLAAIPAAVMLWRGNIAGLGVAVLCLVGWSMELAHANCWIRFDEHRFTHHTFFGRTYEFTYQDVTGIRIVLSDGFVGDVKLYCGKHMIFLDNSSVHLEDFMLRVDKKCKNMRELPDLIKWDPYDHNVPNGKLMFFLMLAAVLIWSVLVPFSLYSIFGPPESEATTERRDVIFTDWTRDNDGTIHLTAEDGTEYGVSEWIGVTVAPEEFCDGKTVCTVWGSGKKLFWIDQLRVGRRMVYTFEQSKAVYRQSQKWAAPILVLFWAGSVWALFMSLRVCKNPDRYPRWLRKLFIR